MKKGDLISHSQSGRTKQMVTLGLMTALICVVAPFSIPIPISPVPISLTNFIIFIIVYLLDLKSSALCIILYLFLGFVGLPVYSAFSSGPGKLAGPTGGYLVGFVFLAVIQRFIMNRFSERTVPAITGMILGMTVCYMFGTAWLAGQMEQSFLSSLTIGVLPYLPGDAVKIVTASFIGPKLKGALMRQNF